MTVTVRWLDEQQTIVLYELSEDWTWSELYPAFEQALDMEHSVQHRVDVILELPPLLGIPPNAVSNIINIAQKQPANLRLSVFLTRRGYIKALLNVAAHLSPTVHDFYRFAETVDDAVALIEHDREIEKQQSATNSVQ